MKVTFGDLRINEKSKAYLYSAVQKNWISEGENVKLFEKEFATKFGYEYAIATSSGTDANICACTALYDFGAKRGDEIIVPSSCFVAVPNSVLAAGFMPKFVDIEPDSLNVNPELIEAAITRRTVAIMVVHNMGKPCDLLRIKEIADKHTLFLIEDCCEAHGAKYRGDYVGKIGHMATFSFFAAHLVVCGEGGMVVTSDPLFEPLLRSVKSHGRSGRSNYFDFQRVGFNSKMNDMEAAIGLGELENFDETFRKRRDNFNNLHDMLTCFNDKFSMIEEKPEIETICPHAFPIVQKEPSNLYDYLESKGIQCKTLFDSLPTQHRAFEFLGYKLGDFPVSENLQGKGLHFGIHQYLEWQDLLYIADTIREFYYT